MDAQWPVVGQFSSIGSLGPTAQQWLTSEWLHSLSCTNKPRGLGKTATALTEKKYPCLQLVSVWVMKLICITCYVSHSLCNFHFGVVFLLQVFPSVDNVKNFLEGYMGK